MKKLFIIISIFFLYFNFAIANSSIFIIDMDKILKKSKPGISILEQLKKKNDRILENFQNEKKNFNEKETKLISQKNILSDKDFKISANKLKLEIDEYNENRKKIVTNFNKLKIDNTNKFLKMINALLIKYSEKKKISIILHKKDLVIGKSELDITDEIIKIINNEINEFKIE